MTLQLGDALLERNLVDFFPEIDLEDLSVGVSGEGVVFLLNQTGDRQQPTRDRSTKTTHKKDKHGNLETRQNLLTVVNQRLRVDPLVEERRLDLDDGRDQFSEDTVRERNHSAVHDTGMRVKCVFDFYRGCRKVRRR